MDTPITHYCQCFLSLFSLGALLLRESIPSTGIVDVAVRKAPLSLRFEVEGRMNDQPRNRRLADFQEKFKLDSVARRFNYGK